VSPPTSTDCLTGCAGGGFPFDAHDEGSRSTYDDVYAVYTTGGTSPLTSACDPSDGTESDVPESANCPLANVDIDAAPSSSTITAVSVSAPTLGQSFTITATVTSTGFTPVPGVLTFRADGSTLATHTLSAAECPAAGAVYTCTFTTASISTGGDGDVIDSAGTYSLTASFSGTEELDASTSDAFTLAFSLATPALTVTLPGSGTITVGDSGNIRAVVSGSPANRLDDSPARLRFFNGGTQLADLAVTNLGGSVLGADFSVSSLAAGSYSIIVQYVANSYFSGTTSTAQTLTVNQATPTVALNSITPVQVGNNLALSGSVSGSGIQSPAGGSVSFYLGGTSGTLLGTDSDLSNGVSISVPTGDGQTLATAGTAYANIVARFNGDATNGNVAAATSAAQSVTLTKRNSTVTTANVTAEVGQAVTLSASVSSGSANASPDCSACVQFKYGASLTSATDIGPAQDVVSGQATLANVSTGASTPFSANSSYTIWAVYAGNANVNGNNDSATLQLAAQVSVTASAPASGTVNSAVTLQATVSPTSAPGTIQFKVNGTNFGSAQTLSSGSASISWTPSATGSFSITAAYNSSSSNYLDDPDSNTATITVNPIAVSVVVTANASVTLGSSILLTADLSPNAAPGIVRFFADGVEISGTGGVTADTSDGDTTFSWTPTSVGDGTATISATYTSSSANYASQATSTNDNVTINPAATTIVATAAQTGGAGSTITLTASITSSFGNQANIDGGNVTWTITAGAGTCTGLTSATVTDGIATLTGVTCPAGNNYNVRGTYTGSGNYAGSSDTTDYDLDVN
jgi:hypothetical protein